MSKSASLATTIDEVLDRTVAPGYSRIGHAVRRRSRTWPADPAHGALEGKDVLVTGASSGLGTAAAKGVLDLGGHVHAIVRDAAKMAKVVDEWAEEDPAVRERVHVWTCDLADLDSVNRCAGELFAALPAVHGIIHNAGALPAERVETAQGVELTMGLHVISPIVLTEALVPLLAPGSQVVFVTSGGMYAQGLPADDPNYLRGTYSGVTAYARSKRAQVELLPILQQRWTAFSGAQVQAMHPGWARSPGLDTSLPTFARLTRPLLRTPESGADTAVWLVAQTGLGGGRLWHDRRPRRTHLASGTVTSVPDLEKFWAWVREQAGLADR